MKKLMTLFLALALAASLTVPALAGFTPSVENKGGPRSSTPSLRTVRPPGPTSA